MCPGCVVRQAELDAVRDVLGPARMQEAQGYHYEAVMSLLDRDPPPWLDDLLDALGWSGGTATDAIGAVRRLVVDPLERGNTP